MLHDSYQRKIEYLRLSVTDLCNIRCRYCIPVTGAVKQNHAEILTFEEIARLIAIFAELGIRGVRLTGGEPLVRKDLPKLIAMLKQIPELEEVSLTTNGIPLKYLAQDLKEAGLSRINVHLDTLNEKRFRDITRGGNIEDVFAGIHAAQEVGFDPIKLNVVLMKGYNDTEIEDLVLFASKRNLILRFIELMPIGPSKEMKAHFLPASFAYEQLARRWTLISYGKKIGQGPAEYFKIVELGALIGFIHPVSQPFCDRCNRIRLSADGRLQDCLAYDEATSLRDLLRKPGLSDVRIEEEICQLIAMKRTDHGDFYLPQYPATCGMYGIGG